LYQTLNFPNTNANMQSNAEPMHIRTAATALVDDVVINIVNTGNSTAQKITVSNTARYMPSVFVQQRYRHRAPVEP
jgi:hypothetical protein